MTEKLATISYDSVIKDMEQGWTLESIEMDTGVPGRARVQLLDSNGQMAAYYTNVPEYTVVYDDDAEREDADEDDGGWIMTAWSA